MAVKFMNQFLRGMGALISTFKPFAGVK